MCMPKYSVSTLLQCNGWQACWCFMQGCLPASGRMQGSYLSWLMPEEAVLLCLLQVKLPLQADVLSGSTSAFSEWVGAHHRQTYGRKCWSGGHIWMIHSAFRSELIVRWHWVQHTRLTIDLPSNGWASSKSILSIHACLI